MRILQNRVIPLTCHFTIDNVCIIVTITFVVINIYIIIC